MQKLPCILLVDDDRTTNYLNQRLLEKLDVAEQLLVAHNGQEALTLLNKHCHNPTADCPVLVLLDMKMPIMDGFSFLEAYKQLPDTQQRNILVVMLSTSLHPQDVQRAQELPITAFLNKPLTNEKVRQLLNLHYSQERSAL
ncbi:response regulator [Hymenobacter wooponensis]|uniref:Response regulator n=1 Tax=Hymenobacter wooponensis TaxID=1525360 RepID=A0A4Z0MR25_9BACT|nr:response regulator [Hymenobacter wooponensis]TGD82293.1 response regulator [Hymenobacter wooponensis]